MKNIIDSYKEILGVCDLVLYTNYDVDNMHVFFWVKSNYSLLFK